VLFFSALLSWELHFQEVTQISYNNKCSHGRPWRSKSRPASTYVMGTSVREYVFFVFSDFKKHDFLRFFEMTYQKVVKSHQQKFSPQYVTKE